MIPSNIAREHILRAIEWIDSKSIPDERQSTKYDLLFNGNCYPPKYVISIANKFANGTVWHQSEFHGGDESNSFLEKRGFEVVLKVKGQRYDSWTLYSNLVSSKVLDRSAIIYNGTGIPREVRWFFGVEEFQPGDKREIYLLWQGKQYSGYIKMERNERTRLFWRGSKLVSIIEQLFPEFASKARTTKRKIVDAPVITFLKNGNEDEYELLFAEPDDLLSIINDIEAEEIENEGPVKEGKVKYYYGKRYERSAVNRKRAIQIHGCKCRACGFDFEKVYGERGREFIEVHHNKPLHENEGEETEVNPETDLDPVCTNCHRMIHRRADNVLTVDELKEIIQIQAAGV